MNVCLCVLIFVSFSQTMSAVSLLYPLEMVLRNGCSEVGFLDNNVCEVLTYCRSDPEERGVINGGVRGNQIASPSLHGYPEAPYCKRLAQNLEYWMLHKECPLNQLPEMDLLHEDKLSERYQETEKLLSKYDSEKLKTSSNEELQKDLIDILNSLGLRGVLDLLGLRNTAGSTSILPPRREVLLESFQRRHSPKAKLTVGARALSKHCHRDGSYQWWGNCTGSEEVKNSNALAIAEKILDHAVWINSHTMVHDTPVLEVRNHEGYGLRWRYKESNSKMEFRGFLEPQMKDGHNRKWRH